MGESKKRPIAIIECCEEIPCNPCVQACPHNAIKIEGGIHHIPVLSEEKCVGCGMCVAKCSGQAIFVVEKGDTKGTVTFPYEMLPLPRNGMRVYGVDRDGAVVCNAVVTKVVTAEKFDHTNLVTIEVPVEMTDIVRAFRYKEEM